MIVPGLFYYWLPAQILEHSSNIRPQFIKMMQDVPNYK